MYNDNSRRKITEYELLNIRMGENAIFIIIKSGHEINCHKLDQIFNDLKNGHILSDIIDISMDEVRAEKYKLQFAY